MSSSPRPRADDLTSFLIGAEIGGAKLSREHIRGTMILLMIAGIDPAAVTWSGGQVRGPRALPVKIRPVRIG